MRSTVKHAVLKHAGPHTAHHTPHVQDTTPDAHEEIALSALSELEAKLGDKEP